MKFKLLAVAGAAACALGSVQAQAQAPSQNPVAGTGLYIGGSIGQSNWKGDDAPGLDDKDTAGKAFVGYEFSPYFGVELGYADLGKFDSSIGSIKAKGGYLDAVGKLPFAPGWSALLRAGLFQGKLDINQYGLSRDDDSTAHKLGVGLQYDLTQNLAVRTEYERYRFDTLDVKPNVDLFSVGVNYRF